MNQPALRSEALTFIRVALTAGVLVLGLVAFFLTSRAQREPLPGDLATTLQLAFGVIAMAALVALAVLRSAMGRATDASRRMALVIAGWAMAEAPALMGGVVYLLSGDPLTYVVGVAILFLGFILIPIPEPL